MPVFITVLLVLTAPPATPRTQMARAFEQGRVMDAVRIARALPAEADAVARTTAQLVLLLAAERRGDHDDVLAQLMDVKGLGDYGVYMGIGAQVGLRSCADAEKLADTLVKDSPFAAASWSRVAACWLREQDLARADVAISHAAERARNRGQVAETMLARARLARAAGDRASAVDIARKVVMEETSTLAAQQAKTLLTSMGAGIPQPSAEELLERAAGERVRARGMARRTLRSALAHTKASAETRGRARLALAELDIVDSRYPGALAVTEELSNRAQDASVKAHALFLHGDILARRGRTPEALDFFTRACTETAAEPYAREAAFTGARLAYASRDLVRAKWFAEWLIAAPATVPAEAIITEDGAIGVGHAASELVDGAHWYAAWTARRSGAPREQIDTMLAAVDVRGAFGPSALYWRFRYAQSAGETERAQLHVQALLDVAPNSFYALTAGDIICADTPDCVHRPQPGDVAAPEVAPPPRTASSGLIGVVTLFEAGLQGEAFRLTRMVPQSSLSDADRLTVAWLAGRMGDIHASALATRRLATRSRAELQDPLVYALAYPRPFQSVVDGVAASYGLPAELLYAIMREESAFDVRAMSPRAARGLMQMMRLTALRIAKEAGVRNFQTRQLFEPPVSVRLGAQYLDDLAEMWQGDVSAIAASYHAGEGNVGRWRSRLGAMPIDEFIEEIPYASTRRYAQKVIASYGVYKILYGRAGGTSLQLLPR